jgi:DNA-binding transcriptional ArsR family regulator
MEEGREIEVEHCQVRCIHPAAVAQLRERMLEEDVYLGIASFFAAMADPTRVKMMHALMQQELCTCDIAATVGIRESSASQHLRVLRTSGLVKPRRAGKLVYYSLGDGDMTQLLQFGLAHLGHVALPVVKAETLVGEIA